MDGAELEALAQTGKLLYVFSIRFPLCEVIGSTDVSRLALKVSSFFES